MTSHDNVVRRSTHGPVRTGLLGVGAALLLVISAACGSASSASAAVPFAAYVEIAADHPNLVAVQKSSGQQRYTLSFLLARGARCTPAWDGAVALRDPGVRGEISGLLAAGGHVGVAFGGEQGAYLENVCPTAAQLAAAYAAALDVTGADRLDLDVEQPVPADRVAAALVLLSRQHAVPITVTLPVGDAGQGLNEPDLALLRALAAAGVSVTVNAMLLDFSYDGPWRSGLTATADAVARQLTTIGSGTSLPEAYHRLGLTLMAGRDDQGALTTLDDARAIRGYATEHGLASLGLWSLTRDNGQCPGQVGARDDCSGIAQRPYEFAAVLSGTES